MSTFKTILMTPVDEWTNLNPSLNRILKIKLIIRYISIGCFKKQSCKKYLLK